MGLKLFPFKWLHLNDKKMRQNKKLKNMERTQVNEISSSGMAGRAAVIDFGKTNLRLLVIDAQGEIHDSDMAPNEPAPAPPYRHLDTEHVWQWLCAALRAMAVRHEIAVIIPTSYGSTAALVTPQDGPGHLTLPVMDYEAEPPSAICDAYARLAPPYDEVYAPTNPAGLTLGRQLFWQQECYPDAFAKTRHLLFHPQYWAWRMSGVAATEVTSLGAQTHLWDPVRQDYSSLVRSRGWQHLFPPRRAPWDILGPITAELASTTGLPPQTKVLCGIHDSNANYLRYLAAGLDDFTLMSTGTWLIAFNSAQPIAALDGIGDTVVNTDCHGRAVACSRFMAGREFAEIAGPARDAIPSLPDVAHLITAGTMALPSFSDLGGPIPATGGKGHITGPPPRTDAQRVALATLYCALMSSAAIEVIGSRNPVVIDGGLARSQLYAQLIAALRPGQTVQVSTAVEGTGLGAALLWQWHRRPPPPLALETVVAPPIAGLADYAQQWQHRARANI